MSETTALHVERAGPLALLQDAGRFGVRRLGVTQGGPADLHAWAWANALLGNGWGAPVLEIALGGGLTLVAEDDSTLALAGADLSATLDGEPLAPWRSFSLRAGQCLAFAAPRAGLRAYLAAPGGFQAEPVLGSVASVVREELGGLDGYGHALEAGDRLEFVAARRTLREVPVDQRLDYPGMPWLALIPGAQVGDFPGESLYRAFNQTWRVDERADRMGVRLAGAPLACAIDGMISEGIALGAVQVPPDGQPIVLLNDRQTIGGYPRLGALTPLACSRLAQCAPGQAVRFVAQSRERAQREHRRFLASLAEGAPFSRGG
ncbi:5-oxoprolinase subunit C family protein [Modicisalibacter radicis]|uniref:5-oxoprolinase subunit C family protein n=1 Tax=Halomonas sp. EAR18 TaxID=2518972 RepID=UPI00109BF6F3|nr:biotin-dependent carboxyltransferase family protein [Halomonas sp. EAR18]